MKLTKSVVEKAQPAIKDTTLNDEEIKGFRLKVTPKGKKVFQLRTRIQGRENRNQIPLYIGDYPAISVQDARQKAAEWLALTNQGIDPRDQIREKQQAKAEAQALDKALSFTFGEMLKAMCNERKYKPRTLDSYLQPLETYSSDWLDMPIRDITKSMVRDRYVQIRDGKIKVGSPANARRTSTWKKDQEYLGTNAQAVKWANAGRAVCTFAMGEELDLKAGSFQVLHENPFKILAQKKLVKKNEPRSSYVPEQKLPRLFKACLEYSNPSLGRYIIFQTLTGLRKNEGLRLKWEDVDLESGVFVCRDTKNGKDHMVLTNPAIESILISQQFLDFQYDEELGITTPHNLTDYVFPAFEWKDLGNRKVLLPVNRPYSDIRHAVQTIGKAAGVPFTMHQLRRSFATVCLNLGINMSMISAALNHSTKTITQLYTQIAPDVYRSNMYQVYLAFAQILAGEQPRPIHELTDQRKEELVEISKNQLTSI